MPISTDEVLRRKVKDDKAFIISEIEEEVPSDETFNIHFSNPEDSGKDIQVIDMSVGGDGSYISHIYDAFDSDPSDGTEVEIQSLLLDSDEEDFDGVAFAEKDVSFTSDSEHAVGLGGGGIMSVGGSSNHTIMTIQPGREIVVEVTNTTNDPQNYMIEIVYMES